MSRPAVGTYPPYFANYINLVDANTSIEAQEKYGKLVVETFEQMPHDKADYSYAPGKWTLKEMLQHVIDTERIFAYRALCIARNDQTSLPGFDENSYAHHSHADKRTWQSLLDELRAVRTSTDMLYASFTAADLDKQGTTNNNATTVAALVFITYGHVLHHINIANQRYLNSGSA